MKIYRGRFAPSPTGALHFGSLVTALGSYLEARRHHGEWLVRIEDLDRPRCVTGTDIEIVNALDRFGFRADGAMVRPSARTLLYHDALARLADDGATYPCACSRQSLRGGRYPGTCRNGMPAGARARAVRVRTDARMVEFSDRVQGRFGQALDASAGDFVVRRADGVAAYHLAVVADDADQGVTAVVRGADLLDSTPRQIYLQRLLALTTPEYAHLPLAVDPGGRKLSKHNRAPALDGSDAVRWLYLALAFLGQRPPARLRRAATDQCWTWALAHWDIGRVPPRTAITVDPDQLRVGAPDRD